MKQEILDALREAEGESVRVVEDDIPCGEEYSVSAASGDSSPYSGDTSFGTALTEPPSALRAPPPEGEAAQTVEDDGRCREAIGNGGVGLGEIRTHWEKLAAEAAGIEGFDLAAALRDPAFVRLTAPGVGVSVEDAWYALHRRETQHREEEEGRLRLAQAVAAASRRPREGGGGASALIAADYRSLSRSEQLRVKKRIAEAASRGEKIYP